jgi:valyl-tRNA synthetase
VARSAPESCPKCGAGAASLRQDEDVLDTWFSSGLWPFSTLGWPEKTADLSYFYPTSVLVTGYDIIFFWVVRMVFSGLECMGDVPFRDVFVHGLVRDEQGRKMSKSLGNGIDPLEVIDLYGADALRFMLINGSSPGNDMRYSEKKIEAARNFANKLWNASRFVIMNLDDADKDKPTPPGALHAEDFWILNSVNEAVREITRNMEKYELSLATQKIYELIWNEYCDWYIEFVKPRLYGEDKAAKETVVRVLIDVLSDLLRLLHPFMPFITEEIWGYLGKDDKLIADAWPVYNERVGSDPAYKEAAEYIDVAIEIIRSIRNIRAEAGALPSRKLTAVIKVDSGEGIDYADAIFMTEGHIMKLAGVTQVTVTESESEVPQDASSAIVPGMVIYVPTGDLLDYEAEKEKLAKERVRLEGEVKRLSGKLANDSFVAKAPAAVVQAEREKLAAAEDAYSKVVAREDAIKEK